MKNNISIYRLVSQKLSLIYILTEKCKRQTIDMDNSSVRGFLVYGGITVEKGLSNAYNLNIVIYLHVQNKNFKNITMCLCRVSSQTHNYSSHHRF